MAYFCGKKILLWLAKNLTPNDLGVLRERSSSLVGWVLLAGWLAWLGMVGWLGWLAGLVARCLVCWLVGWLAGWLAGWLVDWLIDISNLI